MAYSVSVHLNRGQIASFLYGPGGPIVRGARKLGRDVQRVAIRKAPKDTGRLAASTFVMTGVAPGFVYAEIGSRLPYAIWRHEGTGIYGSGRPITPKRARMLRFKPGKRGGGKLYQMRRATTPYVYARSVRGTPGDPYLVAALTAVMGAHAKIRVFKGR